jgi:hypothetical protein
MFPRQNLPKGCHCSQRRLTQFSEWLRARATPGDGRGGALCGAWVFGGGFGGLGHQFRYEG